MGNPEIDSSDSELETLDEIIASIEETRQLQKAMNHYVAPELDDDEIDVEEFDIFGPEE